MMTPVTPVIGSRALVSTIYVHHPLQYKPDGGHHRPRGPTRMVHQIDWLSSIPKVWFVTTPIRTPIKTTDSVQTTLLDLNALNYKESKGDEVKTNAGQFLFELALLRERA
jgi:hypothetical protein